MPLKVLCLLLAFGAASASASASVPTSVPVNLPWVCGFSSELAGVASHYLLYGRDSWSGDALLNCDRDGEHRVQTVEVTFNSINDGFGADQSTTLNMEFSMVAFSGVPELPLHSVVINQRQGLPAEWQMQGSGSAAEAVVSSPNLPGADKSLKMGTLFIRSAKDQN